MGNMITFLSEHKVVWITNDLLPVTPCIKLTYETNHYFFYALTKPYVWMLSFPNEYIQSGKYDCYFACIQSSTIPQLFR